MDGWITINTKMNSDQLEKDLQIAEKKLKQYEKESEKLAKTKSKAEIDLTAYEEEKRLIQEMTDEKNKYAQTEQDVTNNLNVEQSQMNTLNQKYSKQLSNLEDVNKKIKENAYNQEIVKNKIVEANNKLKDKRGIDGFKKGIDSINTSVGNSIKKVAKWALAVFGLRSAYLAVRKAASTLSQYNDQIKADLEYVGYALAKGLEQVVQWLISAFYKLLGIINAISIKLFGFNLFAKASAEGFKNANKQAKELKKTTAGFDEMNVIGDSSSSDSSSGMPSYDLSSMQGEVPSWLQWIFDNGEEIIAIIGGITGALALLKLGVDGITSLGIGLILAGIILLVQGIIDFIKDPSWNNFLTILEGIALIVAGIAVLMGGWVVAIIAVGVAIVTWIIKNWDKLKDTLGIIWGWIYDNVITPIWNGIQAFIDTIVSAIKTFISIINAIFTTIVAIITNPFVIAKETIEGIINGIKTFIQGFVQVFKSLFNGDIKGVLNGFKTMFKGIMDSIWSIAKAPINLIIGGFNALIKGINKVKLDVPSWVPVIGGKTLGFNIKEIPKLAKGTVVNKPTTAIIGEAGPERVIPLSDDADWINKVANAISSKNGGNNGNIVVEVYLDGKLIQRQMKSIEDNMSFATNG